MSNIHPEYKRQLDPAAKEQLLGQRGVVVWMSGLSGSGKSTIANAVEKALHEDGRLVALIDGDNLRSGLNEGLGFSDEDRAENIRRAAEVAKLQARLGAIVLVSLITPKEENRAKVSEVLAEQQCLQLYIKASFAACSARDVKGLYAKEARGEIKNFSGKTSDFEEPTTANLVIDTEKQKLEESVALVLEAIRPLIKLAD